MKSGIDRHGRPGKKTLTLVDSSRRKERMARESGNLLGKRLGIHRSKRSANRSGPSQPKTFTCHLESCGKVFTDRASLKKHMTVHGDKLFQCTHPGCNKRFLDNAKLKRHMLVHTVSQITPIP